jgi:hypothetical protein
MELLSALWMPIVVATVLVFIASALIHMVVQWHKPDYHGVPNEPPLLEAIRAQGLAPGEYYFPWVSDMKQMSSPEFVQRRTLGPVGILTLLPPGPPAMGKNLVQWFVLVFVISLLTGYVGHLALAPGAGFGPVLRVTMAVALLAYVSGQVQNSIWKGAPWGATVKYALDGIIYAAVTGATFAWLWPET